MRLPAVVTTPFVTAFVTVLTLFAVALLAAAGVVAAQALPGLQPMTLPAIPDQGPFPYTLDVPAGWEVHADPEVPGFWVGPPGSHAAEGGELIYVRSSPVELVDPAQVADSIRATAAQSPEWSAPRVQVVEKRGGTVQGLWVEMVRPERTTLVVKLPLGAKSVDFMASAPPAALEELRPLLTRILESVRPVGSAAPGPPPED